MNPNLTAPDAEKAVIAVILDTAGEALTKVDFLREEHFADRLNQTVFAEARGIWEGGGNPDYTILSEVLRDRGIPPSALEVYRDGSGSEHASLVDSARIVQGKWRLREIARFSEEAHGAVLESDPDDVLDGLEKSILALRGNTSEGLQRITPLAIPTDLGRFGSKRVESGYREIDARLGGLGAGRLITIASRPGVGKTTIALNIAANAAEAGKKVGLFSLEMSNDELIERLVVREARVNAAFVRGQRLVEQDVERIAKAVWGMSRWNLFIDDTAAITPFEILARAKKMKHDSGLDLLIVDYVQLITAPKEDSRVQELSFITRSLKMLARELEVPLISLSQLSRAAEMRGGRPRLGDLRESGSIENDSDQVVFLWKEDEEGPSDDRLSSYVNITVGKNRHGPVGEFSIEFIPSQSRFQSA